MKQFKMRTVLMQLTMQKLGRGMQMDRLSKSGGDNAETQQVRRERCSHEVFKHLIISLRAGSINTSLIKGAESKGEQFGKVERIRKTVIQKET